MRAVLAASMISFANSFGCESIGTWLEGSVSVFAFIVLAKLRSRSGWIMRSLLATTYQVGFVFHAALAVLAPKTLLLVAPCVAKISFFWASGRSCAKFSNTPFVVIVR